MKRPVVTSPRIEPARSVDSPRDGLARRRTGFTRQLTFCRTASIRKLIIVFSGEDVMKRSIFALLLLLGVGLGFAFVGTTVFSTSAGANGDGSAPNGSGQ
jgi:hypothetical protein